MDKRQCILEATAELIAEHGLQSCPMSAVARQAGCGAGTIYRYFETKDELVQELYLELVKRMIEHCLTDYDGSACVKLRFFQFWGNFYRYMRTNPRDCALLEQMSACPAITDGTMEQATTALHEVVFGILQDGQAQQVLKDCPEKVLSTFVYGALSTLAKKYNCAPELMGDELEAQQLLALCWDGIKA
jgi:TetR/AcrR family transcriptional repressor of multidrug resistance operon